MARNKPAQKRINFPNDDTQNADEMETAECAQCGRILPNETDAKWLHILETHPGAFLSVVFNAAEKARKIGELFGANVRKSLL